MWENPQISSPARDVFTVEIFEQGNDDPARSLQLLPNLARARARRFGFEKPDDRAFHLLEGGRRQENARSNFDDLAAADQELQRFPEILSHCRRFQSGRIEGLV